MFLSLSPFRKKIPKIIHYVWVGQEPLPKKIQEYLKTWRQYHPDYLIVRWDESNIDFSLPYLKNAYHLKKWANISNLVRLQAVYKFGGIYIDTDVKVLKAFDKFLSQDCFFEFQVKEKTQEWINNAVFGARKKHWFIKKLMTELQRRFDGSETANLSSPALTTELLLQENSIKYSSEGVQVKDIYIFPIETFNPFSWKEKYSPSCITPDTYAIHFFEKSWWDKKYLPKSTS